MSPTSSHSDPPVWFGRLQRAYMANADEAVLAEAADLGRLMAVTEVAVDSVIEVHGDILADALAAAPRTEQRRLVEAADTVLSELMVACRVASQRVGSGNDAEQPDRLTDPVADPPPEFVRFRRGGAIEGDPPEDLFHWLDQRVGHEFSLAARTAIDQRRIALFETRATLAINPISLVVCPFHDGGGVIAIRDITRLVQARERALQRHKLESVGQMASGLAHELNNLLQPILSMAQMAGEDRGADADLADSMAVIVDSARRAAAIVHGMLLYVRRTPKGPRHLVLAEVVPRIVDTLRHALPTGIHIALSSSAAEGQVTADAGELSQILKNLVDNAIHAMAGQGTVAIRVDETAVGDAEGVRMRIPAGRYARLTVSDRGPGISPALLERIFEPFFTTKGIGQGTGLGLSIVQGIVRSWGGDIVARNLPEGGAAFDVMLPHAAAPVETEDVAPAPLAGLANLPDRPLHKATGTAARHGDTNPDHLSAGVTMPFKSALIESVPAVGTVRARLRRATAEVHESLHRGPEFVRLIAGTLSAPEYAALLGRLYGFHAPLERALRSWFAGAAGATGCPIDPARREKAYLLRMDLLDLGVAELDIQALPFCRALPKIASAEDFIGCLYVIEGSGLGGKVIARGLDTLLGGDDLSGRRFFAGRPEPDPLPWPAFCLWLESGAAANDVAAIGSGACRTFEAMEHWLRSGVSDG